MSWIDVAGWEKKNKNKGLVRIVTDKPQVTSKELQEHLAIDNVIAHSSTVQHTLHKGQLNGRVMWKNYFLLFDVCKASSGQARIIFEIMCCWIKLRVIRSQPEALCMVEKNLLPVTVKFGVRLCGKHRYWKLFRVEGCMHSTQIFKNNV